MHGALKLLLNMLLGPHFDKDLLRAELVVTVLKHHLLQLEAFV